MRRSRSKCEFQGELNQPRRRSFHDISERAGAEVAVYGGGSEELGMVEGVKGLQPELQSLALGESEVAKQGHVEVDLAGSVEAAPGGRARRAERVGGEGVRIEIGQAVARILVQQERAAIVVRQIQAVVVYTVGNAPLQRVIAVFGERYRKSRADTRDPGEGPALGQRLEALRNAVERQFHPIGADEVVPEVPG